MKTISKNKLIVTLLALFMGVCAFLGILASVPRPASADETANVEETVELSERIFAGDLSAESEYNIWTLFNGRTWRLYYDKTEHDTFVISTLVKEDVSGTMRFPLTVDVASCYISINGIYSLQDGSIKELNKEEGYIDVCFGTKSTLLIDTNQSNLTVTAYSVLDGFKFINSYEGIRTFTKLSQFVEVMPADLKVGDMVKKGDNIIGKYIRISVNTSLTFSHNILVGVVENSVTIISVVSDSLYLSCPRVELTGLLLPQVDGDNYIDVYIDPVAFAPYYNVDNSDFVVAESNDSGPVRYLVEDDVTEDKPGVGETLSNFFKGNTKLSVSVSIILTISLIIFIVLVFKNKRKRK